MPGIGHSITLTMPDFKGTLGDTLWREGGVRCVLVPAGAGTAGSVSCRKLAPARAPDRRVAPADGADGVTGTAAATHVMVVEDDRDTREVVKLILELEGIGVTEASDGFEALDRLHKLRAENPLLPCAIVLDIMMPRCSGTEFRRRQLEDPLISDVPVIVLSAIADQMQARRPGAVCQRLQALRPRSAGPGRPGSVRRAAARPICLI